MKSELKTRCEFALIGMTSPIKNEELKDVLQYISSAVGSQDKVEDIIEIMFKYCNEGYEVKHFVCNTIGDMSVITITIAYDGEKYDLEDEDGVLCSVYNFTYPDCSELGYCFFENKNGYIKRIG